MSNQCEPIWVQLKEQWRPNMTIGTYYHPPSNSPENLEEFLEIVSNICRTTSGTTVIGSDFNGPKINWQLTLSTPQAVKIRPCQCLIAMEQDHFQTMAPLCSFPHNCVFIDMNVKPLTCKQPPSWTLKCKQTYWDTNKQVFKGISDDNLEGTIW